MNAQTETRILMCSPEHFHVDYVINPWMEGNVDNVSTALTQQQWRNLRETIARFATVEEVPPAPGLPDMVFTANAGTVCGKRAVLSRFFHPERQGEAEHFDRWFRENGAHPNWVNPCSSLGVVANLTLSGFGVSLLLPSVMEEDLKAERLDAIEVVPSFPQLDVYVVYAVKSLSSTLSAIAELISRVSTYDVSSGPEQIAG